MASLCVRVTNVTARRSRRFPDTITLGGRRALQSHIVSNLRPAGSHAGAESTRLSITAAIDVRTHAIVALTVSASDTTTQADHVIQHSGFRTKFSQHKENRVPERAGIR